MSITPIRRGFKGEQCESYPCKINLIIIITTTAGRFCITYRAKNSEPVDNKIGQCCAAVLNNVRPESSVTMLNIIIVDSCKQRRQHNIVQSCFQKILQQVNDF